MGAKNDRPDGPPVFPYVDIVLHKDGERLGRFPVFARLTGPLINVDDIHGHHAPRPAAAGLPLCWYHPPDYRYGDKDLKGQVQIVLGDDNQLYYRSFHRREGNNEFVRENAGAVELQSAYPIWGRMGFRLRVLEYLPKAEPRERYLPADIAAGKETQDDRESYPTAIQCRLTTPSAAEPEVFWVSFGQGLRKTVGKRAFQVDFVQKAQPLGFELKLDRAEQTVDPGTQSAATYSSYVRIFDPEKGIHGEQHEIYMNHPLEHRGLKFFQSDYKFLMMGPNNRPVNRSVFTVSRDPGLGL
jgi:hypothetical protein